MTPPTEGPTFDVCLTTLLTPNTLVAAPWTEVLALPAFDGSRDRAARYYREMDASGALLPTVTRYRGSIKVEYERYGWVSVALFDAGPTRMGHGERGKPYSLAGVSDDPGPAAGEAVPG